jgi:hypothetical protein
MKKVLIFNATFTYADSFDVESGHKDQGHKLLGNYHNVYPIINNVRAITPWAGRQNPAKSSMASSTLRRRFRATFCSANA